MNIPANKGPQIPVWARRFAVIDIETSSLMPDTDILEIAGVIVQPDRDGQTVSFPVIEEFDRFTKMVHPDRANPESLAITGYTEAQWQSYGAEDLDFVLRQLQPKLRDTVLVGFNSHHDWARLERAFFDHDLLDPFYYRRIDLQSVVMMVWPELGGEHGPSLSKACDQFGIERQHAHHALDDAKVTFELLKKLTGKLHFSSE